MNEDDYVGELTSKLCSNIEISPQTAREIAEVAYNAREMIPEYRSQSLLAFKSKDSYRIRQLEQPDNVVAVMEDAPDLSPKEKWNWTIGYVCHAVSADISEFQF